MRDAEIIELALRRAQGRVLGSISIALEIVADEIASILRDDAERAKKLDEERKPA